MLRLLSVTFTHVENIVVFDFTTLQGEHGGRGKPMGSSGINHIDDVYQERQIPKQASHDKLYV